MASSDTGNIDMAEYRYREDEELPMGITQSRFLLLSQQYPWLEFIQCMREGSVKTAMEMIYKKPEVLRNLSSRQNIVLGITFEELQIAKIMAEAARRKIPLTLIEGDGRGSFTFERLVQKTPEYVDAVFYNESTMEYFAVQFKFSDTPENLVKAMTKWRATHQNTQQKNIPEALKLDNVQLVGPSDVVDHPETRMFRKKIKVGFESRPETTENIKLFLDDNKDLFLFVLNEYKTQLEARKVHLSEIKGLKKNCQTAEGHIVQCEQDRAKLLRDDPKANVSNMDDKLKGLKKFLEGKRSMLAAKNQEVDKIHTQISSEIKVKLVPYKTGLPVKALLKDVAIGTAVGAAVDGIIELIISGDTVIRSYYRHEITISQCVWEITKPTALSCTKGAIVAGVFSSLTSLSQYATMAGWRSASALSYTSKSMGPVLLVGTLGYQIYTIMDQYKSNNMTTDQMWKEVASTVSSTALPTAGMIGAAALIPGPIGLVVGAGLAIAAALGNYFLGDSIFSYFIKEHPHATEAMVKRERKEVTKKVLQAAYDWLNSTEYVTDDELHEAYKAACLKHQPEKGGESDKFVAVHAAYTLICEHRKQALYQT